MSDSVRPHRRQPTRFPHLRDSPGKNTGVGCHFLLQCRKVKSEREATQLSLTLSDPMDCSLPGSSVHVIFQARVLEWGAIAFSDKLGRGTLWEELSFIGFLPLLWKFWNLLYPLFWEQNLTFFIREIFGKLFLLG